MLHILSYSAQSGLGVHTREELPSLLQDPSRLIWVDFDAPDDSESALLSDVFGFHPLAIEDCLSVVPNPKIDDYGEYLYVVIHGINAEALKKDELETHDLDMFLGANYLVTYHKAFSRSIALVMERCRKNPALMGKDTESIMHKIIDALVDNYLPIIDGIGTEIEETEKEVFERPSETVPRKLLSVKKDILYLRRIIHPQREILKQLSIGEYSQICAECTLHFKDVYDHIFMISELIETYRDSTSTAMEVYLSIVSNRLNSIMKVLTIIATIMMPLTLITSIYGMNFEYMPLVSSPHGFTAVMLSMGAMGGLMLWMFKRRGWW